LLGHLLHLEHPILVSLDRQVDFIDVVQQHLGLELLDDSSLVLERLHKRVPRPLPNEEHLSLLLLLQLEDELRPFLEADFEQPHWLPFFARSGELEASLILPLDERLSTGSGGYLQVVGALLLGFSMRSHKAFMVVANFKFTLH